MHKPYSIKIKIQLRMYDFSQKHNLLQPTKEIFHNLNRP